MLSLVLPLAGCHQKKHKKEPAPRPVSVLRLEPQHATIFRDYVGRTEAWFSVDIRPQVNGYISQVDFREGQHVHKGQILFRIQSAPFVAQLRAAEAQVARADADIERASAAELKAEDAAARYAPLAGTNAIPRQQYADALSDVAMRKAELAQARASRQIAEAGVEQARLSLAYTVVRAPLSGIIGMRQLTVGALTTVAIAEPLATISQLDPIRITFSVPDAEYLHDLAPSSASHTGGAPGVDRMQFQLQLADGSALPRPARFYALERAVNAQTDSIGVTVLYDNADDRLRPGEYVQVRSNVQSKDVLLVPVSAVRETQGTQLVWIVAADNKAAQRVIQAEQRVGNALAVTSGLKPGDQVIVGGEQKLRPGDPVKPVLVSPNTLGEANGETGLGDGNGNSAGGGVR